MVQMIDISEVLNGVGKKLRNLFLAGKISRKELLVVFNRNKKEADAFDGYGWSEFDLKQEETKTHNPLLRKKIQQLIKERKEKSRCSNNQNALSLAKLDFYLATALGVGLRSVMKALRRIAKTGYTTAATLVTLMDLEMANLMAKKRHSLKDVIYERKDLLLMKLSDMLYDNGWKTGITAQTGKNAGWLVYVYLPDGTQLSWHCNNYHMLDYFDDIECEWDGRACSTLEKLLTFAHEKYNIGKALVEYEMPLAA